VGVGEFCLDLLRMGLRPNLDEVANEEGTRTCP
jgi:hypothetical protein